MSEKRYAAIYGMLSLFLFAAGAVFGYALALPIAIKFFMGFADASLIPMISIGRYLNFCVTLVLLFGILFELPIMIFFLVDIGLLAPAQLSARRRHIIVLIFIIAAILSPPDIFTQFLVAVPLYLLFEFTVLLAKIVYRAKIH